MWTQASRVPETAQASVPLPFPCCFGYFCLGEVRRIEKHTQQKRIPGARPGEWEQASEGASCHTMADWQGFGEPETTKNCLCSRLSCRPPPAASIKRPLKAVPNDAGLNRLLGQLGGRRSLLSPSCLSHRASQTFSISGVTPRPGYSVGRLSSPPLPPTCPHPSALTCSRLGQGHGRGHAISY